MFHGFKFKKSKKMYSEHYVTLILVIIAVVVAILGLMLFKDALFPLIISGIWAYIIKMIKSAIKNYFFE